MKIVDLTTAATAGEILGFSCAFAGALASGETIVSAAAAMEIWPYSPVPDSNAANLVLGSAAVSGSNVIVFAGGLGTGGFQPGAVYSLVVTATTSLGQTLRFWGNVGVNASAPPTGSSSGTVPTTEFAVTANTTPAAPGTYYLKASGITFTLPPTSVGGNITLVDDTGAPAMTLAGATPINMPPGMAWTSPWFAVTFFWSVKYSGWVML